MQRMSSDGVVVVGGGPAGAATAFWLARAGVPVTIVDRARFPRTKACAEYLSPQASRLLDAMGVLEAVEAAGAAQLSGMRIRAPDGTTFEGRFAADHGYRGYRDRGLALPRMTLDAILLAAACNAGAQLVEGWKVGDLLRDDDGRVVGVSGVDPQGRDAEIRARIVIGADGLRSIVGRRLGLLRRSRRFERFALVAHFAGVDGIGDQGEMHVASDGYVGLADVGHGVTNVALVVPAAVMPRANGDAGGFLQQWLMAQPHLAARFRRAERVEPVRIAGPFASHARRAWAPGAALVGDAADFFDPFTGEGIYTALRGGELLAPYVEDAVHAADHRRADAALAAYARQNTREFRGKRLVEKLIGFTVGHPPLINHAAGVLRARREMADLLVGVAGDFVPPSEVLRPGFLFDLLRPAPR